MGSIIKQLDDFWKIYEANEDLFSEIQKYVETAEIYKINGETFKEIEGYDGVIVHTPSQLKSVIRKRFSTMRKNLSAMQALSLEIIDTLD